MRVVRVGRNRENRGKNSVRELKETRSKGQTRSKHFKMIEYGPERMICKRSESAVLGGPANFQ